MKYSVYLMLICTLAFGLAACSRDNQAPTTDAAGNEAAPPSPADPNVPATQAAPSNLNERTPAPASPAPAPSTSRPANTTPEPARPAPAPAPASSSTAVAPAPVATPVPAPAAPAPVMVTVPSGTNLAVVLLSGVSSATASAGDTFEATFAEPWSVDGKVVADRGDKVRGRVASVEKSGKVKGKASLALELTQVTAGGKAHKIDTQPFTAVAQDNRDRDAGIIAGGAGLGAVIGAIAGGKKGAAIGAVLGGGGGTTAVLATAGEDVKVDSETKVNFVLDKEVRLPALRN